MENQKHTIPSLQTDSKAIVKILKIACLFWVIVIIIMATCAVLFTLNRMKNSDILTQAQVKVYQAQADNVGKPQIIEQRYFSPQSK